MTKKIIGIVGGMGPEATADLFMKIIRATPAARDQDHIRVFMDSNTDIPDRTRAIQGTGPSPVPQLRETVAKLKEAGAQILVMPCNTAHMYYGDIAGDSDVEFLHMMQSTVDYIRREHPQARRIGLLATSGTVESGLYHKVLDATGLETLIPEPEQQARVMEAIYAPWGIKAGQYDRSREYLAEAGRSLIARGADVVIMGCTEIPLALHDGDIEVPLIDATEVLALTAVRCALGK